MPLAQILQEFNDSAAQCDNLITNAHKVDEAGAALFPIKDREQITVSAFLNLFIAWEVFLETALAEYTIGQPTINGTIPVKFVSPADTKHARNLVIGVQHHFDYANHQNVRKIVGLYFQNGGPFEPILGAIYSDLDDLRVMRNACAHFQSTTQTALDGLATRILALRNL